MRRRRPPGPVPLSITADTLPPGEAYRVYDIPTPNGTHPLIVVGLDLTFGQLSRAYDRDLDGALRPLVWRMGQVPDPAIDSDGYQRARWWSDDLVVSMDLVRRTEAAGLVYPWPHHGQEPGPLLGPAA